MSELPDAARMLEAAEQAALMDDLALADELLRRAAHIQEVELGPLDPDLASTLNNLAIVAEKTGRIDEAEMFYRRAVAITSASLAADHPMITASRENLEAFCRSATKNAGGAKGPCGGKVGRASTREGMTGQTGSNHPGEREFPDKVRQLPRRLWSAAKRQPGRRFHALLDRIYRRDVLWEAWRRVRTNRGAAGIDAMTLAAVEQLGSRDFSTTSAVDCREAHIGPRRCGVNPPAGR